jgi:NSS family neurotransmitter:Na+ symporter
MAAVGSAVGLGNIWKFPYIAGINGGGAFVLVYLGCVAAIGLPVLIAETMIGRLGGASPVAALRQLAQTSIASPGWSWIGAVGATLALVILSFYSVVAGWALAYVPILAAGSFSGATGDLSALKFSAFLSDPIQLLTWHSAFMVLVVSVIANGIAGGIERAVKWLMPILFVLLLLLVIYAAINGDMPQTLRFLFAPDFFRLTFEGVLTAAGHAFFTLSVGLGAMIAYGGYLPARTSIPGTAVLIAGVDTVCALMAGLAIFPLVFAEGIDPAGGPGLLFVSLPVAFGNMQGGQWFGAAFFVLVGIAALTSAVALLEPMVAILVRRGTSRITAAALLGAGTWTLGILSLLSFNLLKGFQPGGKTLFDWLDHLASDLMLPACGIAIAVFAGWVLPRHMMESEFRSRLAFHLWRTLVRYVAPVAIVLVILGSITQAS